MDIKYVFQDKSTMSQTLDHYYRYVTALDITLNDNLRPKRKTTHNVR